ncbi:hypothetical protein Pmani_036402 [Petrolisthes manimaculis]|uniref:Uncharacterized protein n=1 Tax=Petrolisthes manimaculis TaxID=1843537 RepID=A0AAE1NK83_9EUCA|nr:hypothetical protein Pmani_036402 [Petrolisthes manimaculis]
MVVLLLVGVWGKESQKIQDKVAVQESTDAGLPVQEKLETKKVEEEAEIEEDAPIGLGPTLKIPQLVDIPVGVGMAREMGMRLGGMEIDTRTLMRVNVSTN